MRLEALGPLENRTYKGYAGDIHMSGQHLLNLINDILDLSRIEAGRYTIKAVDVDLKSLSDAILRMFDIRAEKAGISLVLDIDADLQLFADERGIRQVMLNLISNAVKFTRNGGTVRVFGHRSPHGGAEFGVSDTGVGIAQHEVALVFENFGQGQHDITLSEKGTGLGLPIVKGIVEAHGGVVKLVSEIGKGTTVTVFFPKARAIHSARPGVSSAA
jgi:two-component system cell cycle sensor histidine kinase PleC